MDVCVKFGDLSQNVLEIFKPLIYNSVSFLEIKAIHNFTK